ncbi:MAG: radical SAM protein [Chitinivibrionales bacterium]|nr:radical SAM protein [Chitinivibrionales bacterium]
MSVILFNPRGRPHTSAKGDVHSLACVMPPIGLASIAAVLRQEQCRISIYDAALDFGVSNAEWAHRIVQQSPEIVGFTATTSGFYDAYDVCEKIKERNADIRTVFGGVHVSWGGGEILKNYPAIDYIITGEGERAMLQLVSDDPVDTIEGLAYRQNGSIKLGPGRRKLYNLDDLPFPAYDLLPGFPRRYLMPLFGYPQQPGANIASSRGCVYQCSFCDRSVFQKSFRHNSPEYTVEQMTWLNRDFGVKHINFYDDLFTLNRTRVARLCELLRTQKSRMSFNCIARIGHIDDELIRLLKLGGCWMVNVGIESGDQDILDAHKDRLSLEMIRRDITRLHNAGIWVKGLFMMGFPGETEKSIARTREFALSLPLKDANITAFTPFPGAPITHGIEKLGAFDNDWSKMDCEQFVFVPHSIGSKEKLEQHYRLFIKGFYQRPAMRRIYRTMLLQSPHSYWRLLKGAGTFLRYASGL